ncbi:MAG TPA: NAD(P)H-dependent oxidoreductase subunit E [Candidatus Deferrimicrobium sp.]|nr:NAD(P)H-dependent oxidoreductase subunit E [Candidatus Deferrimicrobium sp.]
MEMDINSVKELILSRKKETDTIIKLNKSEDGNLISLLQKIQEFYNYLPTDILYYISEQLKIPPAEIYGVATFYTQFKIISKGKNVITCCEGTACHIKGGDSLLTYVENYLSLKSGETTPDEMFSLESVACLGCCAISPVCIVNNQIYGNLTLKKMKKILNQLKKETQI